MAAISGTPAGGGCWVKREQKALKSVRTRKVGWGLELEGASLGSGDFSLS